MNVSTISINENNRRNFFIKYSNSFMSLMNGNKEAVTKTQHINPIDEDKKLDKSMGIETLTIFPKQVIDGKTIITA